LVTEDLSLHFLGVPQALSRDGLMQAITDFYTAFPDNTHVIEQTLAADDRVAVMLTQHATSKGAYEGAAPTGQRVTIPAIHIMRFDKGRIREWWALEDNLGLMQQLGLELKPRAHQ
jgi:predicted ester cyclase